MNKAQTNEEKAKLAAKYFDCAEAPIKEWLAEYLSEAIAICFPDYSDDSDVIGFQDEGNQYDAYLVTLSANTPVQVDKDALKTNEKMQKACSMLFDAVLKVFAATISSSEEPYATKLRYLRPIFDEQNMRFGLMHINGAVARLHAAMEQKKKLDDYLQTHQETHDDKTKTALNKIAADLNTIFTTNNKEAMDADELICQQENDKIKEHSWLYIVVEVTHGDSSAINSGMNRLPKIGLTYQDPDEDNYIDKLKKEHDVI